MIIYTQQESEKIIRENKDRYYVYGLHRPDKDEIFYIGKGKNFRVFAHLSIQIETYNKYKDRIIKKVGPENIKFLIKFVNSEEDAFEFEKKLIARYKDQLCNLTDGGEGTSGHIWPEESRKKLSNSLMGHGFSEESKRKISFTKLNFTSEETRRKCGNSNRGKHLSEETRRKMSESRKGKKHSEETRRKMSETAKKILRMPASEETRRKMSESRKGRIFSEETKRKISESNKGKIMSKEARLRISETLKEYNKIRRAVL